eukprot:1157302-Pelagomonas_calceolata.AAC.14
MPWLVNVWVCSNALGPVIDQAVAKVLPVGLSNLQIQYKAAMLLCVASMRSSHSSETSPDDPDIPFDSSSLYVQEVHDILEESGLTGEQLPP